MKLPENIQIKVNDAINDLNHLANEDPNNQAITLGIQHHVLPLIGLQGGPIFLRSNGVMFELSDEEKSITPEKEIMAIVAGSEFYSWLRELLPTRAKSDIDCPVCKGKGKISYAEIKGMYCPEGQGLG